MAAQNQKIVIVIDSDAQGAVSGLNQTQKAIKGVQDTAKGASSSASQFGSALRLLVTPITNLGVGLRQMGQALQGVGFIATAFISIPIAAAFKSASDAAIGFDAALVAAQKTTGLMDSEVGRLSGTAGTLSGELRKMAQSVATPLELLGGLSEQAGQLGVRGVDNITKFVRVAEILGQTTEIAAEDAIETFGRLTQALGVETDQSASYMLQLANAINLLENTTTASAKDIANGMRNAISAASGFDIAGADLAAFIATMYQMGVGSLESGTMFSRMAGYVTTKTADLAELVGKSTGEIRKAFDEDFTGGLLGVLQAIGNVESASEQMAIASDIFGQRAARGVILLANSFGEKLVPNLQAAREEFQNGSSIIDEYVQAMSSTQAQIGLLQNNLKVLGVTLGDTFLPIVNTLLQYVVPAIQIVTEVFAGMDQKVRVAILAAGAFLAVLGPLATILGTLAFSTGIAISGIENFAVAFAAVGSTITPVIGVIASVGIAMIGLSLVAEDAMVAIRDTFKGYANAARTWGNNLIGSFAAGMLDGIAAVINAAITVANAIAQFFASFSPPKKGPLSQIMVWGKNLIDTYISGFKRADFSAIEDVTSLIGRYFKNLGKLGLMDEAEVIPGILDIRKAFVELIKIFQETGEVSQGILDDIAGSMGELGAETSEYLRLLIETSAAQKVYDEEIKKLEEIRDLRDEINKTYDRQVRAITQSGKPLLQQLSAIVDARYARDESLANLDEEEDAQEGVVDSAEEQLDVLKDQLDTHAGLLDFYLDELDLLAEQKSLMGSVAGSAGAAAKAAGEFAGALSGINLGGGIGKFTETIQEWDDLISGIDLSIAKFQNGRAAIEAFFAGLRGEFISDNPELAANISPEVVGAIKFGRDIRSTFDTVKGEVVDFVETVKTGISDIGTTLDTEDIKGKLDGMFSPITDNITDILGIAVAIAVLVLAIANLGKISTFVFGATEAMAAFSTTLAEFGLVLKFAIAGFAPFVAGIAIIALLVGAFVTAVSENLTWFKELAASVFKAVAETAEGAGLLDALKDLGAAFVDLWSVVSPILYMLWRLVVFVMTVIVKSVATAISAALPGLITFVTGVVNVLAGVIGFFSNILKALWALITGDIQGFNKFALAAISAAWTSILGVFQIVGGAIVSALGLVFGAAVQIIASIINALVGGTDVTAAKVVEGFSRMALGMNKWMTQAKDWVIEKAAALGSLLGGILELIGIDFENVDKRAALAAQGVGGSLSGLENKASGTESAVRSHIDDIGLGFLDLEGEAARATSNIGGDLLGLGQNASGLEGIFGGAFSGIFGSVAGLESDTASATAGITQNLDGVGEAWGNYETSGVTSATNVLGSVGDMEEIIATFGLNSASTLTDMGTEWATFDTGVGLAQTNMTGYIDLLGQDTLTLETNTSTATEGMGISWEDLAKTILGVTEDTTGGDGYYKTLQSGTQTLSEDTLGNLSDMEGGWNSLESTINGVINRINTKIDSLLTKMQNMADEAVNHSIIPDMNDAIVQSFNDMITQTTGAVGAWSSGMLGDFSAIGRAAPAQAAPSFAPDVEAVGAGGPLVTIDKMIVPSVPVGNAMMDRLSGQIAEKAGWRRRGG